MTATSKNLNNSILKYGLIPNATHLNTLNQDCPKWIIRNATENPWFIFTQHKLHYSKINNKCLYSLQKAIKHISRIHTLDLSNIVFDEETLSVLDDLLKQKTFSFISLTLWKQCPSLVNRLFKILGEAKGIESFKLTNIFGNRPLHDTILNFSKSSKTMHLIIGMSVYQILAPYADLLESVYQILAPYADLLESVYQILAPYADLLESVYQILAPYADLLENLESITISSYYTYPCYAGFLPPLDTESLNRIPNLNSFFAGDYFDQAMQTKESITGASLNLGFRSPHYTGQLKKLKSFTLKIYICNNETNIFDLLLNSKDTLESLSIELHKQFSFNHPLFKNNKILKHLSITDVSNDFIDLSILKSNLDLSSFTYSDQYGYVNHHNVLEFIESQTNLSSLSYHIFQHTDSFLPVQCLPFYQHVFRILRGNKNIKRIEISLPLRIHFGFVKEFVGIIKRVGRFDYFVNSICADVIVHLNHKHIPLDLNKYHLN